MTIKPFGSRRALLLATALAAGWPAGSAWALDDCGAALGGVVICNAAKETPKPNGYQDADGITYVGVDGLTLESYGDGGPSIEGIHLEGTGALTVRSHIDVAQVNPGFAAPGAIAVTSTDGGAVTVTVDPGQPIVSNNDLVGGIYAFSGGSGGILIASASTVTTRGALATGISAQTVGGPITIGTRSVSALGADSLGINAFAGGNSDNDDIAITVTGSVASNFIGIQAQGGGSIDIGVGNVTTRRADAVGIFANTLGPDGDIAIVAGNVSTVGSGASGIRAIAPRGAIDITVGALTTTGATASGVVANGGTGDIDILVTGPVRTTGSGIFGQNVAAIAIQAGDVATTGDSGSGVFALTTGVGPAATVDIVAGRISTMGDAAIGIAGSAALGGAVTIRAAGVTTLGDGAVGVTASSLATALIELTGDVSTRGDDARGISVFGDAGVSIAALGVSTRGDDANAVQASATSGQTRVAVNGDIVTLGDSSRGVLATTQTGVVQVIARSISTQGQFATGIEATAFNAAPASTGVIIQQSGTIHTTGDSARGVLVTNPFSATATTVGSIITEGATNSAGINVNAGSGALSILATGDISTRGTGTSEGITVTLQGAPMTVETQGVSTRGATVQAISLYNNSGGPGGQISLTSHGLVSAAGDNALAIRVINLAAGGVFVSTNGVRTTGAGSSQHGMQIDENDLAGQGGIEIHAAGLTSTEGNSSIGIAATSVRSAIFIAAESIATQGSFAYGISATTNGMTPAATIRIVQTGLVETFGLAATGINAAAQNGGDIGIDARRVIAHGQQATGINAFGAGRVDVAVDVVEGGWGNAPAIQLGGTTGNSLTVRAGGSVSALGESALAIFGTGPSSVDLYGTMTGIFSLSEGDDTLTVHGGGRLELRSFLDTDGDGVRDGDYFSANFFGGGSDLVSIEAGGVVALPTVGDDGDRHSLYYGLERLRNAGLIDLRETGETSNPVDDRLVVSNYEGAGGGVFLDVKLNAGGPSYFQRTDRLLVAGDVTGTILVSIKNAGGLGADTDVDADPYWPTGDNQRGISILQVSGNVTPDQVQLAKPVIAGAFRYELAYFKPYDLDEFPSIEPDETYPEEVDNVFGDFGIYNAHDFRLQSTFWPGVYEYAALLQGASLLGQSAMTALLDRPRDAGPIAASAEQSTALGLADTQLAARATAGDGVATGGWLAGFGEGLRVEPGNDVSFEQSSYGLQAGYDLAGWTGLLGGDDRLIVGVVATTAQGALDFDSSDSELDLSLYGGGLYAAWEQGSLKADAAAQLLYGTAEFRAPLPGIDTDFDLASLGLAAGVGWRQDFAGFWVEPAARLAYVRTWSDDFTDGYDVPIGLKDMNSLVARGSVTLATRIDAVEPRLTLGVAHEFMGDSGATASGLTFNSSLRGTVFEVGGGLRVWDLGNNLTVELQATYSVGDEVQGLRAGAGLKLSW